VNEEEYSAGVAWLLSERNKYSRTLSKGELLDIIAVQLHLRHEAHKSSTLPQGPGRPKGKGKSGGKIAEIASRILRRSPNVCVRAWKQYLEKKDVEVATTDGPRGAKVSKIPRTQALRVKVRDWLHEREISRQRTVAKDLLDFLVTESIFPPVVKDTPKQTAAALRATQRYAKGMGLKRGKRRGQKIYLENPDLIVARDTYVTRARQLAKTRRFVYTDESYIHHHYKCHDDSLFDPSDKRPAPKEKHKGRRLCFIAAIVSKEPPEKAPQQAGAATSDEQSASPSSSAPTHPTPLAQAPPQTAPLQAAAPSLPATAAAGTDVPDVGANPPIQPSRIAPPSAAQLLHETIDIFEGGKQTKDYHGMFDSKYYIAWMRKLLSSLAKRGLKNTVIVMDNAKYHKTLPDSEPRKSWKKDRLQQACTARGIPFENMDTKAILWDKLQKNIGATSKPTIVTMAEDAGHTVLFTPPRYSDLQPIEMVWAVVKNRVGHQYTAETSFKDVDTRLRKEFENVTSEIVEGCIKKATTSLEKLHEFITKKDKEDEESSDEGSTDPDGANELSGDGEETSTDEGEDS
jgi:transposase